MIYYFIYQSLKPYIREIIGCASKKLTSKRLQAQLPAKYEEEVVKSYRNNLVSALPRYHEGTARRVCRNQNGKGGIFSPDVFFRGFFRSFVDSCVHPSTPILRSRTLLFGRF